ncbi:jg5084, partial [Pararge aegeria aegeria]
RSAVSAKTTGIRVDRLRKAREGKVVLGCQSKDELAKVAEKLRTGNPTLLMEEKDNRDPLVIMLNVLNINTDEDILGALKRQNSGVLGVIPEGDYRACVKFRRKARNQHENHVILQVSPPVWQRLVSVGKAHIDLQRVVVKDQSPLVRCSRCLGYGHGRKNCNETVDTCSHCAGQHLRINCPVWKAGDKPNCRNCQEAKQDKTDHNCFEDSCPIKIKWEALARARANLQRAKLATKELLYESQNRKISFALVQEPYVGADGELAQARGHRVVQKTQNRTKQVKSAIIVLDDDLEVVEHPALTTENITVATIQTRSWRVCAVSIYFEDSLPIEPYLTHVQMIKDKLKPTNMIIGGDANAWSTWWGSELEDHRGEAMMGVMEEMEMHILNEGNDPTFFTVRNGNIYKSIVDVTACTQDLLGKISNWKVDQSVTSSDHNAITFTIRLEKSTCSRHVKTTRKYNTRKAKWALFGEALEREFHSNGISKTLIDEIRTPTEMEDMVERFENSVKNACEEAIPPKIKNTKFNLPWWTEELETLKKKMMTRKRRISCAAPRRRKHVVDEYLQTKEKYKLETMKAQIKSWKEFCGTQDRESVWDGIYRVIRRTSKLYEDQPLVENGMVLDPSDSVQLLARTFFPQDSESDDGPVHAETRRVAEREARDSENGAQEPPFTMDEMMQAAKSFNPKKAPGADGFTADICLAAIKVNGQVFLSL